MIENNQRNPSNCPLCGSENTGLHSNGGCKDFSIVCHDCDISITEYDLWGDEGRESIFNKWDNLKKT